MKHYVEWIAANVQGNGYGKCQEHTEAMAKVFPELTRVRGHYICPTWGRRAHWWLVASDGQIVDPTATQFPSCGLGDYEPWNDTAPEPTGKCMECGGYCYGGRVACSRECDSALAKFYGYEPDPYWDGAIA